MPFPSPMHESESEIENEVAQSCLTLLDLMDYSLPGFSVHGILQARVLEWGAIAFSDISGGSVCFCTEKFPIFKSILEKAMATHSRTLAWKILLSEELGRLESTRSPGVGHD